MDVDITTEHMVIGGAGVSAHWMRGVHLVKNWTNNKLNPLPNVQRWGIERSLRARAAVAWRDVGPLPDTITLPVLVTLCPIVAAKIPDADAYSWMIKRVIDGAVDARVLPGDGPEIVAGVALWRAERNPAIGGGVLLECGITSHESLT